MGNLVQKSEEGKCPSCNKWGDNSDPKQGGTIITQTKAIFTGDEPFNLEPGLWWIEVHKCTCGTLFCFENGA